MKYKNYLLSDERYSKLCSELIDDYLKWLKGGTQ